MAKDRDPLADSTAADSQGLLSNVLDDEREGGWQMLWRLGSWAGCAVGALTAAFFAAHMPAGAQRDQVGAVDMARQSQQLQAVARESQAEARRLAAAIATLGSDRDRLYARITVLEQSLDSVTGSVARQAAPPSLVLSSATQAINVPPMIAPPAATAASEPPPSPAEAATTTLAPAAPGQVHAIHPASAANEPLPATAIYAPPDPAAPRLVTTSRVAPAPDKDPPATDRPADPPPAAKTAAKPAEPTPAATDRMAPAAIAALPEIKPVAPHPEVAVQRTEFGVDLGSANSIDGLRALWQGYATAKGSPVAALRPIMVLKERHNGLGLQLRLVAGPLDDAAAAARICATLAASNRPCETAIFDGQRLAMSAPAATTAAPSVRPHRRAATVRPVRRVETPPPPPVEASAPPPPPPAPASPSLSSSVSGLFRSH